LDLLGLVPAECTTVSIQAALQRQLDRVGAHPESDTPEADEVRLALHAAAAQLLDPQIRRLIVEQRGENLFHVEQPTTGAISGEFAGVRQQEPEPIRQSSSHSIPLPGVGRGDYQSGREPDPNAPVKKAVLVGGIVVGVFVLVMVGLILLSSPNRPVPAPAIVGSVTSAPKGIELPSSAVPSSETVALPSGNEAVFKPSAAVRSEFVDGALVVRDLRAASTKAKADPVAGLVDFRKAVARLAEWWPRYDVGIRRAADDAVLEFLYVVSEKPEASGAITELGRRAALPPIEAGQLSPEAVWPAAWATGALTRLSVERGIPRALAAGVAQALNDALGAGRSAGTLSFEGGAEAALRRMPVRLVAPSGPEQSERGSGAPRTSEEGIKRWADAVALVVGEQMEVERLLVDGLEQILLNGPEPDADRAAFEAIEVLATRIRWRAGGPARERVLEWFNDPRVSGADLRVLTSILAGKSNAEGVDATMQLSVTATPDDRALLRAQYANAWGLTKTEQRDKALERWRTVARGGYIQPGGDDDLAKAAKLVVAVRINHAARRLWLGDVTECGRLLADVESLPQTLRDIGVPSSVPPSPIPGPGPGAPIPRPPGIGFRPAGGGKTAQPNAPPIPPLGDGPWAEQYLRAERNIPVRLQRLIDAESLQMPLSRVDAAVLAEAACFASPGQVRAAAQRVVAKFADDPAIVQSMLDELPVAPKVQSVADAMARVAKAPLPKIGDPEWELAARRALVGRLLGMLAGQGPQAGIDQACALIGESYIAMAGVDSGPPDEAAPERCLRGAGQLFKLWRMEAERLPPPEQAPATLDRIERRRRSRQQIALGPVQAFAGEEVSVAEMLAYMACAERPTRAPRALAIMEDMARERRGAEHVFDQMAATERAITRLWMLRFGEVGQ
jgi:hypothetical protein